MALKDVVIVLFGSSKKQREIRTAKVAGLKGTVLPATSAQLELGAEVTHVVVDLDGKLALAPNTFDAAMLRTMIPYPALFPDSSGSVGADRLEDNPHDKDKRGRDVSPATGSHVRVVTSAWLDACIKQRAKVAENGYRVRAVEQSTTSRPPSSSSASASSLLKAAPEDQEGSIHSAKRSRIDHASAASRLSPLAGQLRLFPTLGPDLCTMTTQTHAVREEGARATAAAGHWSAALGQYNQPDSSTMYPNLVLHHDPDDGLFVVRDLYPKAKIHLLILAAPDKLSAGSVHALTEADVPVLQCMRKLADRLLEHFHRISGGAVGFLPVGFHSTPSLRTLHLHVVSSDLDSPFLKHKTHWNSFTLVPSFFVPLDMVLAALLAGGKQQQQQQQQQLQEEEKEDEECKQLIAQEQEPGQMPPVLTPWRMHRVASTAEPQSAGRSPTELLRGLLTGCISKDAMERAAIECPLCGELPGLGALRAVREHWAGCKRRASIGMRTAVDADC
jgi:hypothetical protein